ncbi:hypothetical protein EYC80_008278 [Monilinia laxa]|uniref:Uncharacterized protein n=1 Tax=Monilinia laxa TaxID=61186 RepID=A0A5N6JU25_MONLA|nr:hypothetical protein EYC80_008278 [Monilinia laxa]
MILSSHTQAERRTKIDLSFSSSSIKTNKFTPTPSFQCPIYASNAIHSKEPLEKISCTRFRFPITSFRPLPSS